MTTKGVQLRGRRESRLSISEANEKTGEVTFWPHAGLAGFWLQSRAQPAEAELESYQSSESGISTTNDPKAPSEHACNYIEDIAVFSHLLGT